MAIRELAFFPQITLSEGQGLLGTRKWVLDHDDDLDRFLRIISHSHFPWYPDAVPISIQAGAFFDDAIIKRDDSWWSPVGAVVPGSNLQPRYYEDLGELPRYNEMLVVAQYALHKMHNCWPIGVNKPWHPPGTTLSLKIRGSGQYLLITAAGTQITTSLAQCNAGLSNIPKETATSALGGIRVLAPVTEYHLSCGRMTKTQVDKAYIAAAPLLSTGQRGWPGWSSYQGCVNSLAASECRFGHNDPESPGPIHFLNAPPGTLLFDGYEVTEEMVADAADPHRYRMTACFKERVILNEEGGRQTVVSQAAPGETGPEIGTVVGWNHDYVPLTGNKFGWHSIYMWRQLKDGTWKCKPRYPYRDFSKLFGDCNEELCGDAYTEDETVTLLGDCDLCVNTAQIDSSFLWPSSSSAIYPPMEFGDSWQDSWYYNSEWYDSLGE